MHVYRGFPISWFASPGSICGCLWSGSLLLLPFLHCPTDSSTTIYNFYDYLLFLFFIMRELVANLICFLFYYTYFILFASSAFNLASKLILSLLFIICAAFRDIFDQLLQSKLVGGARACNFLPSVLI